MKSKIIILLYARILSVFRNCQGRPWISCFAGRSDAVQCCFQTRKNTSSGNAQNAALQWRHNGRDSVSNHQHHDCLLNRLFRRRSKKTSKLRVTGLCAGNSPGTGEFPAQMSSYAENVSIWWRHHVDWWNFHLYSDDKTSQNISVIRALPPMAW